MKKRVFITGGTSDLGEKIIDEFIKRDYEIIFSYYKNKEKALKILEKYKNYDISTFKLDISNDKQILSMCKKIGKIDILINNAAINSDTGLFEKTRKDFKKIFEVNLFGPFSLIKGFKNNLDTTASIVNISSTNGIDTMYPESCDYDASKAALINLTLNLASYMAPIRVNTVAPGWINTSSTHDMEPKLKKFEEEKIALKRFAEPEEIASVVEFLSSERASYITGTVVRVDGGKKYEL